MNLCLRLKFIYVRFIKGVLELSEGFDDNYQKPMTLALRKKFGSWRLSKIGGQVSYSLMRDEYNNPTLVQDECIPYLQLHLFYICILHILLV